MTILDRFRLDGKRALITGGSKGLGRAMAQALAEAGADLVLVGRESQTLQEAATELAAAGRKIDVIPADVGQPDEVERMCDLALRDLGPIDILINNVGGRRINIPTEQMPRTGGSASRPQSNQPFLCLNDQRRCCAKVGSSTLPRFPDHRQSRNSRALRETAKAAGGVYEDSRSGLAR